jgi:hypothetical protein
MSQPVQRIAISNEHLDGVTLTTAILTIETVQITNTALTEVMERIDDKSTVAEHILTGRFAIIFNNAEEPFDFGFMIALEYLTIRAENTIPKSRMMVIICQYLFDMMEHFLREIRPENKKGQLFTLPAFLYAESHFEYLFPAK